MPRQNPGFRGYYLIDCNSPECGNIVTATGMFDSWSAVQASNDAARTFVKKRLADLLPEPAEAVGDEAIVDAARQGVVA